MISPAEDVPAVDAAAANVQIPVVAAVPADIVDDLSAAPADNCPALPAGDAHTVVVHMVAAPEDIPEGACQQLKPLQAHYVYESFLL